MTGIKKLFLFVFGQIKWVKNNQRLVEVVFVGRKEKIQLPFEPPSE